MNKLMTTLAAIALSFGAFANITTLPLKDGLVNAPFTAKIVGIKAVSSTASGTVSVKEVMKVASSGYLSEAVSNKFLLGGTDIVVSGTAFTGGNAYLILER